MIHGSCLCGGVKYEIHGELGSITHCHCPSCQKAHASAFSSVSRVQPDDLIFTVGKELLSSYESSPGKKRYFCSSCGSQIYAKREDQDHFFIRMGTINGDPGVRPVQHIFTRYKAPWYNIHDEIPEFPEWPVEVAAHFSGMAENLQSLSCSARSILHMAARKKTATSLLTISIHKIEDQQQSNRSKLDIAIMQDIHDEMKKNVRDSDLVERLDQMEFAILLPYTGCDAAIILAERIANTVKRITHALGTALNIGVATLCADQLNEEKLAADSENLIDMASRALCTSKELGTDRVTHYDKIE